MPRWKFLYSLESFIFIGDYTVLFVKSSFTIVPIWSTSIQRIFLLLENVAFSWYFVGEFFVVGGVKI